MKLFRLAGYLAIALMVFSLISITTDKEQNYLPTQNGEFRSIYLILGPNEEPTGERTIVATPFGQVIVNEQPTSMSMAEVAQVKKIGEDTRHQHAIGLRSFNGKMTYTTYDDRIKTQQEAFADLRDFENFRLKNNRI